MYFSLVPDKKSKLCVEWWNSFTYRRTPNNNYIFELMFGNFINMKMKIYDEHIDVSRIMSFYIYDRKNGISSPSNAIQIFIFDKYYLY